MKFGPRSISLTDTLVAGGVGAVNIAAKEADSIVPLAPLTGQPFQNITDITRVALLGVALWKRKKEWGEAMLLADIPLLVFSGYDAILVYALKQTPLKLA